MSRHTVIAIGASAGGVEAVKELVSKLPAGIPSTVLVVIHFPPNGVSILAEILNRAGPLPAAPAVDGERLLPGRIYTAAPNRHLLVERERIRLSGGPRENHSRPSIDTLFRSVAHTFGPCATGVVLSGMLNDGTAGMIEIKKHGGCTAVQDPNTALFSEMPRSAMLAAKVDYVLTVSALAPVLDRVAREQIAQREACPDKQAPARSRANEMSVETMQEVDRIIAADVDEQIKGKRDGHASVYSCPDCGGVLWERDEEGFLRFRCHVGHVFSGEILFAQQTEAIETSMWYAVRALVDKSRLAAQLAAQAQARGHSASFAQFEAEARIARHHADALMQIVQSGGPEPPEG